ncbi:FecCD family ABC transporter permease [Paenibacillus medicaginis]|uniref:FecCD family ABC transporter permease n=1 Tax=Paenibacillus medicaginis TaxID=1470560 RepID=A0ABV5BZ58_9BACL
MRHVEKRRTLRAMVVCLILLLVALMVIIISLNTGTIRIAPMEVFHVLFGGGTETDQLVLFEYRLPRILVTMLAGIGLGTAGAVLQGISRNSLADPGILGLNAGAAFGLIVFVSFFRTMEGPAALLIPIFTFAAGMLTAMVIVLLAYDRFKGLIPVRMLLVGIAIEAGISAVTLFLSLRLDEDTYSFTARWLAGSVWGRDWVHVLALLPWVAILVPLCYTRSRTLDLFTLGDEMASGIGSRVNRSRIVLMMMAVAVSCASVAMTGSIGFIGLIAPHIARRLAGPRHAHFLPASALTGLVILVTADTVGRSIFTPNAVPAGVVVAAIGGPYFLYLLLRTKS